MEGDFYSSGDQFRLRHAYGEIGDLLVGQTWTTFTDVAAAPATLDFEGSVSSVNRGSMNGIKGKKILLVD